MVIGIQQAVEEKKRRRAPTAVWEGLPGEQNVQGYKNVQIIDNRENISIEVFVEKSPEKVKQEIVAVEGVL